MSGQLNLLFGDRIRASEYRQKGLLARSPFFFRTANRAAR
jgi:hypothetical protein